MSTDTELLARTLQDRSEQMTGTTLGLDEVKTRAHRIRRRRQALTGTAAAIVLAIAVPVGISVTDSFDAQPVPPANQTPNPDETDNAEPRPSGPIPADGAAADRGTDPTVAYSETGTLHTAEGTLVDLGGSYEQLTPYAGGWLATRLDTGRTYVLDEAGDVLESWPGDDLAVSPDGEWIATVLYATGGIDVQLRPVGGTNSPLSTTVAFEGTVDLTGFLGPEEVVYDLTGPNGETGVYVTDYVHRPRRIEGVLGSSGTNAANRSVSALTSIDESEPGSCSAVVDVDSGGTLWETCDFTLEAFSPDARYVLATDQYGSGIGGSTVAILDAADGAVVAHFTTRDLGFTGQAVWESPSSVLLSTYQGDAWYLLRLRPDGTVEQALDAMHAGELARPWDLVTKP